MKKIIFLLIFFGCFCYISCNKSEPQQQEPYICCSPPPTFEILINKNSEFHKDFLDSEGNFDKQNVLYRLENGTKKEYGTFGGFRKINHLQQEYLSIRTKLSHSNDIYTGKTETIYLQNATKTYKIEVEGAMVSHKGCCPVAELKEIRIDGQKIEDYFWVK